MATTELPGLHARVHARAPALSPEVSSSQLMRPKQRNAHCVKAVLSQQSISFDAPPLKTTDPKPTPDRLRHQHETSCDVLPRRQQLFQQNPSGGSEMSACGRRLTPTLASAPVLPEKPILFGDCKSRCNRYISNKGSLAGKHAYVLDKTPATNNIYTKPNTASVARFGSRHDQRLLQRDVEAALSDALTVLDVRPQQQYTSELRHRGQGLDSVKSAPTCKHAVSSHMNNTTVSSLGVKPLRTIGLSPNPYLHDRFSFYTET
jgi:hypothetical protein